MGRCYYCGGNADNIEHLGNTRIEVCNLTSCQQEFWEEDEKRARDNRNYDNWRLRSE
jgi:hypothetical protein